jgi:hypothetical protein
VLQSAGVSSCLVAYVCGSCFVPCGSQGRSCCDAWQRSWKRPMALCARFAVLLVGRHGRVAASSRASNVLQTVVDELHEVSSRRGRALQLF